MTTKTCAFCGERAYRLPFANGDEWVDSKGNRWLFHKCREGGAARSQSRPLKPGPGNLPVKVSTEKLRRIQSRIASESRKEEEKRAALKKKKKAEARKAGIARSIEAKKSRKTSLIPTLADVDSIKGFPQSSIYDSRWKTEEVFHARGNCAAGGPHGRRTEEAGSGER